jgi:hypothetical protein
VAEAGDDGFDGVVEEGLAQGRHVDAPVQLQQQAAQVEVFALGPDQVGEGRLDLEAAGLAPGLTLGGDLDHRAAGLALQPGFKGQRLAQIARRPLEAED